ncbi:hypothetical protein [Enterococcus larvae]|uniref:hypothetical protein n=1 Tax=Enterococcus larvae TaxID=2794352 RepID=UPI003F3784DC
MTQPIICNSDTERPIFPVDCPDGWWAVPVNDLSEIKKPDRDHAYLLPDNSVWILNYDGTAMIQLSDGGNGDGQPTQVTNTDGYITITGSGTHKVTADLSEELVESVESAVKDIQLSEGHMTFTKNDSSEIDIKLGGGLSIKDNEIFVDVEDKNEPTEVKNVDGFLNVSGSGTHDVTIDLDYDGLKKELDFYSKVETDERIVQSITGEQNTVSNTCDFEGKILGSLIENPNTAKMIGSPTLQNPDSTNLYELNQLRYDGIKALNDDKTYQVTNITDKNILQVVLTWNLIEEIERKYPNLFDSLGAVTVAEKTVAVKKMVSSLTVNVWGYGSGIEGNKLTIASFYTLTNIWENSSVNQTNTTATMKKLTRTYSVDQLVNRIDEKGQVSVLAYAPASDGTIPSIVNIDYASLDYALSVSASDIYALKAESYTKTEIDTKLAEKTGMAAEIPANTDLNTYLTEGSYKCSNNTNAASLTNCPVGSAFNLQVIATSGVSGRGQILTTYTTTRPLTYYRATVSGTFGSWYVRNDSITLEGDVTGTWTGNNAVNATATINTNIPKLATVQMNKITADNGTNLHTVSSGNSLLSKINEIGVGFYTIGVSGSASDVPSVSSGYQALVQANTTSNPTGTVQLKANSGQIFYRAFTSGNWVDEWNELSEKFDGQKVKVTTDDGRPIATLTSGTILSKIKETSGVMSLVSIAAVTDHPPTTAAFRFISQMTSTTYGNVIGVDDNGNAFSRAVVNGVWKTDWKQLIATADIASKQDKLIAGEDISIKDNVISVVPNAQIDAQALLNGVNIGAKYRTESTSTLSNVFFLYQDGDQNLSDLIDFEETTIYQGSKSQDLFGVAAISKLSGEYINEQESPQQIKSFVANINVPLERGYLYYVNLVINYEGTQYSVIKEITQYG